MRAAAIRLALLTAAIATAATAAEPARKGNIPEGMWVLNQARSHKLTPVEQVLWIIKDDGRQMTWVSIETDAQKRIQVTSWSGPYDGDPVEATGSGMRNRLTSAAPGKVRNWGDLPGGGTYDELCVVAADAKRMRCTGEVQMAQGKQGYVEDFDWAGRGPKLDPIPKK